MVNCGVVVVNALISINYDFSFEARWRVVTCNSHEIGRRLVFDILLDLFTSGGRNLSVDELESCRNGWNEKKWTRQEDYSLYCQVRRRLIGFVGSLGAN